MPNVIDSNIDAPRPNFPHYQQPQGLTQADPRFHKPLMKLIKQKMPRKMKTIRRPFTKKKSKIV
jgi:hypothetical protein